MIVMDQVPINTDEDIKVKVLQVSSADYEDDYGFLTWEKNLNPSENAKYRISYEMQVSYISVVIQ